MSGNFPNSKFSITLDFTLLMVQIFLFLIFMTNLKKIECFKTNRNSRSTCGGLSECTNVPIVQGCTRFTRRTITIEQGYTCCQLLARQRDSFLYQVPKFDVSVSRIFRYWWWFLFATGKLFISFFIHAGSTWTVNYNHFLQIAKQCRKLQRLDLMMNSFDSSWDPAKLASNFDSFLPLITNLQDFR